MRQPGRFGDTPNGVGFGKRFAEQLRHRLIRWHGNTYYQSPGSRQPRRSRIHDRPTRDRPGTSTAAAAGGRPRDARIPHTHGTPHRVTVCVCVPVGYTVIPPRRWRSDRYHGGGLNRYGGGGMTHGRYRSRFTPCGPDQPIDARPAGQRPALYPLDQSAILEPPKSQPYRGLSVPRPLLQV